MLLVALSCLQGRTQLAAFDELSRLPVEGIQLTPGNLPSPGFRERVQSYAGALRCHHSFSYEHYRAAVYDESGKTPRLPATWSLHPPPSKHGVSFRDWLRGALEVDALCEVMYPGYSLGTDAEIEAAVDAGLRLAVDVSHLNIQRRRGDLRDATLARLLAYSRVEEVHVSHNSGRADSHQPLAPDTWGLDWARERHRGGGAVIFESRMHGKDQLWEQQLGMFDV